MVITISMIAVSRSRRMDQSVLRLPDSMNRKIWICSVVPSKVMNTTHDRIADRNNSPVEIHWAAASPKIRQPKPQSSAPTSGAKRMMVYIVL